MGPFSVWGLWEARQFACPWSWPCPFVSYVKFTPQRHSFSRILIGYNSWKNLSMEISRANYNFQLLQMVPKLSSILTIFLSFLYPF
jgi:hypothetical protein